ncbi:hypothetical protein ACFGY8_11120 [Pasteurella multocida]
MSRYNRQSQSVHRELRPAEPCDLSYSQDDGEIGGIHLGTLWGFRSFSRQGQALRVGYAKP